VIRRIGLFLIDIEDFRIANLPAFAKALVDGDLQAGNNRTQKIFRCISGII